MINWISSKWKTSVLWKTALRKWKDKPLSKKIFAEHLSDQNKEKSRNKPTRRGTVRRSEQTLHQGTRMQAVNVTKGPVSSATRGMEIKSVTKHYHVSIRMVPCVGTLLSNTQWHSAGTSRNLTNLRTVSLSAFSSSIMMAMSFWTVEATTTSRTSALEAILQIISSWENTQ